jgi:hypothetical protein
MQIYLKSDEIFTKKAIGIFAKSAKKNACGFKDSFLDR